MYKKISLALAQRSEDGEEVTKEFGFLACATTGFRYRQLFGSELMGDISGIMGALAPAQILAISSATAENGNSALDFSALTPEDLAAFMAIAQSGKLDCVSKMAYIMNKQAEGANMRNLEMDDYLDWLDQFESLEFLGHSLDFINLYMANVRGSSTLKKDPAPSTVK